MASNMESAIDNQLHGKEAHEVTELMLDSCKAAKVAGLEKFTQLTNLYLNNCGLTTLEGFPPLPNLVRLELSDNNLSDGLEALQDACLVNLKSLSLGGNKFVTLESLKPLGSLPNLRELDLYGCTVTEVDEYRSGLFDLLPSLKYLDGYDADNNEKEDDDDDEGSEGSGEDEESDITETDEDDGVSYSGASYEGEEGEEDFDEEGEEGDLGEGEGEGEDELEGEGEEDDDEEDGEESADGGGKRQKR